MTMVRPVATMSPNTTVTAMAMKKASWNSGSMPSAVVSAAIATGRRRLTPDSMIAFIIANPARFWISISSISTMAFLINTYDMHATMCRALRLEFDDVNDPITEVPAPEGASMDVMAAVDASDT